MEYRYDTYVRFPERIEDGQEVRMLLRDVNDYRHLPVRVRVYKRAEAHPDKEKVAVRTPLGIVRGLWAVEVLEQLGEEELLNTELHLCAEFKGGI